MRLLQFFAALCLLCVIPAKALQSGDFTYTATATAVTITGYTGTGGVVTIPSSIGGLPVTSIGSFAFSPNFNGIKSMTSVTIPNSVTSIGYYAFYGCSGLTSVTIPNSVTSIRSSAFSGCGGLIAITVDSLNGVYSGADGVLFNKSQSVLIQCPGGKTGNYPIPASVIGIGDSAFSYCTGLTSVTIPVSVTRIGESAFSYCSGLTSVTIPASVTGIGSLAFSRCNSLTAIMVALSNSAYSSSEGVLFNKSRSILIQCPGGKTGAYSIPSSVISIGYYALSSCSGLTNVTIPSSVTILGSGAFSFCRGLTSVTIPSSVTSIAIGAFRSCSTLTSATFIGNAPSITANNSKGQSFELNAIDFKVYFFSGKSGFTAPTWMGYPSVSMGAPSALSPWLISYGYPHNADLEADSDGDGVSLLLAYSLNLDPRQNLSDRTPRPVFTSNQMSLIFYAGSEGVSYKVESSTDLKNWTTEGVSLSTPDINKFRTATVSTTDPGGFMRIVVAY